MTFGEVAGAAFPAVAEAASRYDPDHESGASFPTFAMKHIKGEVARIADDFPPLAGRERPEDRAQEEPHAEEEPLDFADLVALVRKDSGSEIAKKVYQSVRHPDEYPSAVLRRLVERLEKEFAEELERDAKLKTLHSNLDAMSIRAEDYEGKMLNIGTLGNLLRIRDDRRARGMSEESYSAKALAREFGRPSPNTLIKWFRKCDEQGITSRNWTPEQLVSVIRSRRGPKFRGRLEPPNGRPEE